ncbi:metal dependent phosphohydrolase [Aspergillus fijiensis CBS 313.89]|uniref:Metal dependent phosphohydrolase n=1 Tax=Aspergillus fijiensis CBS 313.89 TaxID=1448319 RepID=A0A8G1W160_9EURO|nr:metal dependent phosphohydrolase [Aspergillus fijiensis CBS 313.89]RAK76714.1 metal dependent phosphohydrolase [Aspergillus fijiensis CBS 313.89]
MSSTDDACIITPEMPADEDLKAGHFQTLTIESPHRIIITDTLYGTHEITEPVLLDLLQSPDLQRLIGICQHGVTGHLGLLPGAVKITRFEHSVGACLLVRTQGATLEEQVAALLHDISHTVLSHVVDWALSNPQEESFHEVHKARYLQTTGIPAILARHGMPLTVLHEEQYPLVELPAPHLCADRLDYALRDGLAFGKLTQDRVRELLRCLRAFPYPTARNRILVLEHRRVALGFARAYLQIDQEVWSNPAHADMYKRTGRLIGDLVRQGKMPEEVLWTLSDEEFWALLLRLADAEGAAMLKHFEREGLAEEHGLPLPRNAKIRTVDPDVWENEYIPAPLSQLSPEWAAERQAYIARREATRALD